ncbi:MAG TPA: homoserine kinase [Polyangiaceae bacterium]|jgi:homoserine kinase type II|nr:homoserine kinase [Polyangiaceae bacterium]
MALLTELSLSAASPLAKLFNLDLRKIEPLTAGSVNSNFRLTDSAGKVYFARLYEEQDRAGAAREHAVVAALDDAGVPVVRALRTVDGGSLADFEGKAFAVFPWVDGQILCQARVTPEACFVLGAALARVHLCSAQAPALPGGRFRIPDLRERLARVEAADRASLLPAVRMIRERLDHYEATRAQHLEQGICHGDLFRDNVLWQGPTLRALIDFESVCQNNFAYDLMVTALAWCYGGEFELGLVQALFDGYRSVRPLPAAEVAALRSEGAIACLRFATTRLTDFSLRVPEGTPPVREYGRFLARMTAIEGGALDACIASLGA